MIITRYLTAAVALSAALLLGACRSDGGDSSKTQVAATTTQVADMVRNVAGDRAEVDGILAPNSDPHEYEPRPSDAQAVADADVIFQSGGDLDLWLDQILESSGTDAPVVTLIDSVRTRPSDEDPAELDPHWWEDPTNAVAAVGRIRDALDEADPAGADTYDANAAAYVAKLKRLDRAIAACMERVPAAERKLVTSHDALGYYGRRYGVEIIGAAIPAQTTQAQASAGETADLIDLIRSEHVNAIFPEAGVSAKLEQAIADNTGAEIGGQLWADALGPQGSSGATYLEAMAANTRTMVDGFTDGEQSCAIDAGGA